MAITKYDQFDFLIDIVPRDEVKPAVSNPSNIKTETPAVRTNNQDQVSSRPFVLLTQVLV